MGSDVMKSEIIKERLAAIPDGKSTTNAALLVSHDFSMTGAPLALLEMAKQIEASGTKTVIVSSTDGPVRREAESSGLSAVVVPQLYDEGVISDLAGSFGFAVFNTLETSSLINEINGSDIPAIWWIHEAEAAFINYCDRMPDVLESNITVRTVGPRVRQTLHKYRPWLETKDLLYAIEDMASGCGETWRDRASGRSDVTFALVGSLERRKGQDVLLEAVRKLSQEDRGRCRFIIVGEELEEGIAAKVRAAADEEDSRINYIRRLSRGRMLELYNNIDCLICASRDDPMPMTVTEACMMGRVVICSDNTGSAPLLERYDAGIVYHDDDPEELAECIKRVMTDHSRMGGLRGNARKLYEENFTPEIFAAGIRAAIEDIKGKKSPAQSEPTERNGQTGLSETSRAFPDNVRELREARLALDRAEAEKERLKEENKVLKAESKGLRAELAYYKGSFAEVEDAFFWKISGPARRVLDFVKETYREWLSADPAKKTFRYEKKRKEYIKFPAASVYSEWMRTPLFSDDDLAYQRDYIFSRDILFSITVPLYNTPETFLREMIDSVISQTYSGWELCLADGSDSDHAEVGRICSEYCGRDSRIRYKKLEKNLGISENTNACLDMASGDYIALLDHDDVLHPAALHEMMGVICDTDADIVYTDEATFISPDLSVIGNIHFKPDYAPDNLRANNYICHFTAFRRSLLEKTGGFRSECNGSQDHDMILRLAEVAERVEHIPEVLYFWRAHQDSAALDVSAKGYAAASGRKAVRDSVRRQGMTAAVRSTTTHPCIYRLSYELRETPLISIIIPSCDHADSLKTCIDSIQKRSTYSNYEIIIAENNSREAGTFEYYDSVVRQNENVRVIKWEGGFNYSAINNYAAEKAAGKYILLLNNDTVVISAGWIEEMLMYAQREDVGAVGAMLYYPDDTIQHAGVILGKRGIAGHAYQGAGRHEAGYMGRLAYAQNMTAVTAACMLIRRDVWDEVGGLDEELAVAFNDVDLCLKIRRAGYLIVWTPYAELYHCESLSRGSDDTPEKQARFDSEVELFRRKWRAELAEGDPYYNPNLSLVTDFALRHERQRR